MLEKDLFSLRGEFLIKLIRNYYIVNVVNNKNVQVVMMVDTWYGLDFKSMSGPESTWKNKYLMEADWRIGYEALINYLNE